MDLVQDAMHRLVRRYGCQDKAEWGPLFHRILQNGIRDWYRRTAIRRRWHRWFGNAADSSEPGAEAGTDDGAGTSSWTLDALPDTATADLGTQLDRRRLGEALDQALRALPVRQQQAFLLRAWEELDVAQTARAMGCSEGSVKTHFARATRALRERLEDFRP